MTNLSRIRNIYCENNDLIEQKHGHWIEKPLDKYKHWEYKCSNCGATYQDNYDGYIDVEMFNYCPNCSARIDVVTND